MKRRGSQVERELQRKLWDLGFVCLRIAGSGSSSFPALDLIAIKGGKAIGFEVKSTRKDSIYLKEEQLEELKEISEKGKVKIFIAVKFIGKGWYFFKLEDVLKNRKIDLERAREEGLRFENIVNLILSQKIGIK